MRVTKFVASPGFIPGLMADPKFQGAILAKGIDVRKGIKGNLPSGASGGRRVAAYARKAYAEKDGQGRDFRVVVGTRWRLGHLIEFGSVNNPAYSPLRKSVLAAGLRLSGGGR